LVLPFLQCSFMFHIIYVPLFLRHRVNVSPFFRCQKIYSDIHMMASFYFTVSSKILEPVKLPIQVEDDTSEPLLFRIFESPKEFMMNSNERGKKSKNP
jgi:hypothetical protein